MDRIRWTYHPQATLDSPPRDYWTAAVAGFSCYIYALPDGHFRTVIRILNDVAYRNAAPSVAQAKHCIRRWLDRLEAEKDETLQRSLHRYGKDSPEFRRALAARFDEPGDGPDVGVHDLQQPTGSYGEILGPTPE